MPDPIDSEHAPTAAVTPVLDRFARATPELMKRRELLRRTDTKILLDSARVPALLEPLRERYALLHGGVSVFSPYSTLYFDTEDLRCFHDHRRGKRLRHKVRIRHYRDRKVTYLEVKSRRSDLVSFKHRVQLDYGCETMGPAERAFVASYTGFAADSLRPLVWIDYRRATLINLDHTERFTIDLDFRCMPASVSAPGAETDDGHPYRSVDDAADRDAELHRFAEVAFLEIKQAPIMLSTPVMRAVREVGLRSSSVSKYCTAVAATNLATTRARFKAVLTAMEMP